MRALKSSPRSAKGSGHGERSRLKEARKYFRQLYGALDDRYVERMPPGEVKHWFSGNPALKRSKVTRLAHRIFGDLMDQVGGQI